ncbi:MAG: UDP-N-acetylmuramoyl-L-alanyl-D-glutamate--2,6-diaminopimelate ligase, partial [Deltaproteobacteria bacterium]|nr:UDP-N-acetylmuramoyl-L-alanyl-D-glutamate--2,6-diaminopimelate ligase [Deltaproteobacteria bacterium]
MKLSELLLHIEPNTISGIERNGLGSQHDLEIGSIHYNAQDVKPGGLFVAIPGFVSDGHDFIDTAIENGAGAVIVQKPIDADAIIIEVKNTRKALASLSSRFYGDPSEKMVVIGITGTNGKTTITFLLESILSAAGYKPGVIGSINYRYAGKTFDNPRTT